MFKNIQNLTPRHNIHELHRIIDKSSNIHNKIQTVAPLYMINCNEYDIKENEHVNDERFITFETKPLTDFNTIIGNVKAYKNLPAIKISKCPKFFEK